MTEAEWLGSAQPLSLLNSPFARSQRKAARPAGGDERFRRFGIACCRRVARVLEFGDTYALDCLDIYSDNQHREPLLKARRFHRPAANAASHAVSAVDRADRNGLLLAQARLLATSAVWSSTKGKPTQAAMAYREAAQAAATLTLHDDPALPLPDGWFAPPSPAELAAQCGLLRCVFGDPFRPVTFDPEWRTAAAVGLARSMYEARDFAPMPVLADALEDAGCDHPDVIGHCRGPGPHVRGCWVVDLVRNKS